MSDHSSIELSTLESEFQSSVSRLCRDRLAAYQTEAFYNTVPRELVRDLANLGLMGLSIPEEFGGIGADPLLTSTVMETLAHYDLGPAIFTSVHGMVAGLIGKWGSPEQKERFLPKLSSGEWLAAFALTEPQAGSDAAALSSHAVATDAGYLLSGDKCYISGAGFADIYLVFARTLDPAGDGISAFLVEATAPGIAIGKPESKMGCELSPIASMLFTEVAIPAHALLGPLHKGFKVAMSGLARGRVNIGACANGISMSALQRSIAHLSSRKQFGNILSEFQALQFMVADMHMQIEAARLLVRSCAKKLANAEGAASAVSAATAKCFATDVAMKVTTDAVQLLGGAGYLKEFQVERLMREAKMLQIVEGTNQIQRVVIGRALLERTL